LLLSDDDDIDATTVLQLPSIVSISTNKGKMLTFTGASAPEKNLLCNYQKHAVMLKKRNKSSKGCEAQLASKCLFTPMFFSAGDYNPESRPD